jgi:Fur family transcriptional regulator, ferric uptake regulator
MPHCHTFIEKLRQRGYRITPQREMIIQTLAHSGHHMTAENVATIVQARASSVNLATVYRTLDFLVQEGLASRIDLGTGQVVYATALHGSHAHLVCRQCGCVIETDDTLVSSLQQRLRDGYGFDANVEHLAISGICQNCQPYEKEQKY